MISSIMVAALCTGSVCSSQLALRSYVAPSYVVKQQLVAPIYYFVGAPIRAQSLTAVEKAKDPDWQEFLEYKKWKAMQATEAPQPIMGVGIIGQYCAKCHSGLTPKAGVIADGNPGMRPHDVLDAIEQVALDKMPKDRVPLSREEKTVLVMELLKLREASSTPSESGQPPVEETPPPEPQPGVIPPE